MSSIRDTHQSAVGTFSALIPTYNRAPALRRNLQDFLNLRGLAELIIVDDGSSDGTPEFLDTIEDSRLRIIRHDRNRGSQAARTTAIEAARCPWILMLDDDCLVPPDYGETLLRVARNHPADVVSAPWVHAAAPDIERSAESSRRQPVAQFRLETHPSTFPPAEIETPFLPPLIMARREIFDSVRYDARYRGNAWREETDVFVAAMRAGFRCVLTPQTFSYQTDQWGGGQRRNRLSYEWWCAYNNWLFLRAHGDFLRAHGLLGHRVVEQARFLQRRGAGLAADLTRKVRGPWS